MIRLLLKAVSLVSFLMFFSVLTAHAQDVPTGVPISLDSLISISENIGGFLMVVGGILAAIAIIYSGILYLLAGSDSTKVKGAKDMLKAALIGALIIFSTGVIIDTIRIFASDPLQFFQ